MPKHALAAACSMLLTAALAGCPGNNTADTGTLDTGGRDAPTGDTPAGDTPRLDSGRDAPGADVPGTDSPIMGSDVPGLDGGTDAGTVDGGDMSDGGDVDGGGTDGGGTDAGADSGGVDGGGIDAGRACRSNADCGGREYCAVPDGVCGPPGVCAIRPTFCPLIFDPVCGCDDMTYDNDCTARSAGVNVASRGACGPSGCMLRPADGCCFEDSTCPGRGSRCVNEVCRVGGEGTCVGPLSSPGECWEDSDCTGGRCMGARICACGMLCTRPDAPGRCSTITP